MVMTVDFRFVEDAQVSLPFVTVVTVVAWRLAVVSSALFRLAFPFEQLAAVQ